MSEGMFQLSESCAWSLINLQGSTVLSETSAIVNLSNYSKGVYILKTKTRSFKLIH